ncbi:hypothetical protein BP6252_06801 [Coleophoma cylindrospora]|uniref:F-box domain-containing protein n=1 Tax=Coleophoma cylindrospora TaxID=1849047 RepID=A0A3D8RGA1_9HELO|nr:hypothetical protein BP6252_06801 [Coleophoma cylindrospora]
MSLSDIPIEIRLRIFSELLVLSEPIEFVAKYGPLSPPLFRRRRDGLYPAILRVSRMMHLEASPLLYSMNRFHFPAVCTSTPFGPTSAHISPFLHQIGSRASLIHYICIPFFTFHYPRPAKAMLPEAHARNLQLIQDTCIHIQTLEMLSPPEPYNYNYALGPFPIATEALDLLNTRLKSILSLKDIIAHFQVYPEGDERDHMMRKMEDAMYDLMKKMSNYGWAVKVTKLPEKPFIPCDDIGPFADEEDSNAYDEIQF